MNKLTEKQAKILEYIKEYIVNNGFPPTVREIGKFFDLSSPATIHSHLNSLVQKGFIKKNESKNRAIELLVKNEFLKEAITDVPLLGTVTAGNPIEAIETPNEFFSLPTHLIPQSKDVFTLKVSGESMINIGIYDKDIVIVQKQSNANNGDIVVAMTEENEVTLKTFYKEKGYIRLQPENDTMEPFIMENCTILGKAIGLYRKF